MADVKNQAKQVIGEIAGDHALHHVETQEKNPLPSQEGMKHTDSSNEGCSKEIMVWVYLPGYLSYIIL